MLVLVLNFDRTGDRTKSEIIEIHRIFFEITKYPILTYQYSRQV